MEDRKFMTIEGDYMILWLITILRQRKSEDKGSHVIIPYMVGAVELGIEIFLIICLFWR